MNQIFDATWIRIFLRHNHEYWRGIIIYVEVKIELCLRKVIHNVKNNYDVCQKYFCRGKIIYVQTYIELCLSIINNAESKMIMPRHKCHIDDTNEPPYVTNLERSQHEQLKQNYE